MGLIQCKKHGRQTFFQVCEHIHSDFRKGIYGSVFEVIPLGILICQDCKKRIKIEELGNFTLEEISKFTDVEYDNYESKFSQKYDELNINMICRKCADDAQFFEKINKTNKR